MRTSFDLATVRVKTEDGYERGIDDIIDFVTGRTKSTA